MNVHNRRGIENILLRRVRRHQSMTALFRAPGMASGRPRPAQAQPVIQKQEQESPVDVPMAEAIPSLPVIPVRSDTAARKVVPPPPSTPKPLSPLPSAPLAGEPAQTPDPIWKRLQTIFRKHEEGEPHTMDAADVEAGAVDPAVSEAQEEKALLQTTLTKEHSLPTRNDKAAIPAARTVQHASENIEPGSKPASLAVQRKVQSLPSTRPETKAPTATGNTAFKPAGPDKETEVNDQVSTDDESEKSALPLESAWNVQRVEAPHPLFGEGIASPTPDPKDVGEGKTSLKTSPVPNQKPGLGPVQLQPEENPPTDTKFPDSQAAVEQRPVETLFPGRPRPRQANLPLKSASIQRQSQDQAASEQQPAAQEVNEASPVNTAIGPLPADLWWLLGQKPPAAAPAGQPEIQRTIQPAPKQAPSEHGKLVSSDIPAEPPAQVPSLRNPVQRQALANDPLPSGQREAISSARAERSTPAEPDLDDLARRVYAEVRHRLAAEWERRR